MALTTVIATRSNRVCSRAVLASDYKYESIAVVVTLFITHHSFGCGPAKAVYVPWFETSSELSAYVNMHQKDCSHIAPLD